MLCSVVVSCAGFAEGKGARCSVLLCCAFAHPGTDRPPNPSPHPCAQSLSVSLSSSDWRNPGADLGFQMSYTEPFYGPRTTRNVQVGWLGLGSCTRVREWLAAGGQPGCAEAHVPKRAVPWQGCALILPVPSTTHASPTHTGC